LKFFQIFFFHFFSIKKPSKRMDDVLRSAGIDPTLLAGLSLEDDHDDVSDGGGTDADDSGEVRPAAASAAVGSDDEMLLAEFEREQGLAQPGAAPRAVGDDGELAALMRDGEPLAGGGSAVSAAPPTALAPSEPAMARDSPAMSEARARAVAYKRSALVYKNCGDRATAIRHLAVSKRIEASLDAGVVPSPLPPPPGQDGDGGDPGPAHAEIVERNVPAKNQGQRCSVIPLKKPFLVLLLLLCLCRIPFLFVYFFYCFALTPTTPNIYIYFKKLNL
jgi:hypothetical protein